MKNIVSLKNVGNWIYLKQTNLTSNINIKQVHYMTIESAKRKAIKLAVVTYKSKRATRKV